MKDLKYTISRSFSRKIPLGQYNMADFFASHSQEISVDTIEEEKRKTSETLFLSAKLEVEAAIEEFHKAEERKKNNQSNTEFEFGLEKQDEADNEDRLAEANKGLGLK